MLSKERQQKINDLREMLDWLEDNPHVEVNLPSGSHKWFPSSCKDGFLATAKKLGNCEKDFSDADDFSLIKHFGTASIRLTIPRSAVCRKVTVMKEVEDWECDPLFSTAEIAEIGGNNV